MTQPYHPTTLAIPPDQLREHFLKTTHTHTRDLAWHFEIGLPRSSRMANPIEEKPVAIHARLLQHHKAWIAAAVVGPARDKSPLHWMQSKRLLDIACMTLEFT